MSKIHVALIEDDELTRSSLRTVLKQHKEIIWVGEASNGIEGLQLLRQKKPDVAIVDLGLDDLDGIELTKRFKMAKQEKTKTKILILTINEEKQKVLAAFSAGADSYCLKDIKIDLLIEALKATHQGNTWIDPVIAHIILSQAKATLLPFSYSNLTTRRKPFTENLLKHNPLTQRELEVLQLIVDGYSNAEISEQLYITVGTVKTHVRNILNKLCADDRTQAAVHALRSGLVG